MEKKARGIDLIWGDMFKWYDVEVVAKLRDATRLFENIQDLENCIFAAFISFILSKRGYFNQTVLDLHPWDIKDRTEYTSEFHSEDWIQHISAFSCWEEYRGIESDAKYEAIKKHSTDWTVNFSNIDENIISVKFLSGMSGWYFFTYRDVGKTFKWVDQYLSGLRKSDTNYIVVHPSTYYEAKLKFKELNNYLYEQLGQRIILTSDEFLHKFIPGKKEKEVALEEWVLIREEILGNVRKDWPNLIFATHSKLLSKMVEKISSAEGKYRLGPPHYSDAIKDAALACEGLLNVLNDVINPKQSARTPRYVELLFGLKEIIKERFGENMFSDLDYIRKCRNEVSHPTPEEPDGLITFQVVTRAKMFYDLISKEFKEIK